MFERLRHLPREARDTLFLLLVIAWVIAPQVGNLPIWCSGMTALILLSASKTSGLLTATEQSQPMNRRKFLINTAALGGEPGSVRIHGQV